MDVAFTAASAREADVTVVIDALRATSTITEALAGGYSQVRCVDSLERALTVGGEGRVLAGERECLRPPGFDLGNSPADVREPRGAELVLATTNGAPAIVRAAELSPAVLIGSLLNLGALVTSGLHGDVLLLCAGTGGRPSIEDTYVAGRIVEALVGAPRTDAALMAVALARSFAVPFDAFSAGAGGRALVAAGLEADVAWCARESVLDAVGAVVAADAGEAVVRGVGAEDRSAPRRAGADRGCGLQEQPASGARRR